MEAGRFFLKTEDPNDGYSKPIGYEDSNGTVKVTLYLPIEAEGEYVETTYRYDFYYLEYVDESNGNTPQLNSTRMYVVPTIIKRTYKLTSGGQKELINEVLNYKSKNNNVYISFDHMYCRNAFTIFLFSLRIGKQRHSYLVSLF